MNINQLKTIHSWIRNTEISEISEILFVSALILPLYLLLYNYALNQINESWKDPGIILALIIYVVGIIWMKSTQSNNEKDFKDITIIKNYTLDKDFEFMSFVQLQEVDKKYNEERIKELIYAYPNELRLAKLAGNKKGIKILNVEKENK